MPLYSDLKSGVVVNRYSFYFFNSFLFFMLSLFDFYKSGVRVFELVGYTLLLLAIFVCPPRFRTDNICYFPLLFFAVVYFALGMLLSENYKSTIGLFIGVFAFVIFSIRNGNIPQGHLRIILTIHLFFFFMQLGFYYLFDQFITYHEFTDIEQRLESSIFRPAGLFYEPAIYCLAVYMLLMLIDPLDSRLNLLEIVAVISMVLSLSVWGIAAAFLLSCRLALLKRKFLYVLITIAITLTTIGSIALSAAHPIAIFFYNRLTDIGGDGSATSRYGSMASFFQSDSIPQILFGSGFGASFEQFGANGISYLLSSVGVVGSAGLVALILFFSRHRVQFFILFVPVLLAAPIFAYGFFPIWLSQITNRYRSPSRRRLFRYS